ncbi:SRPBCC family protein [Occultella gossypii]|uniref:SRPBCC domain-containing protein n=1 Tax=Occultella gossypii TaxID=2800820 RepID=A0ABS7S4N9_9MICO|nr:SRPBCC domain-containing protein [Occultella gossypii]MBZ2195316.1 SRPBCC domain-containing protein [Occultella gossypii]
MAEYTTSIEIDAPQSAVFEYLTTAEGMTAWMGQHASLDPRPGGGFAVDIAGYAIRGEFLTVEPPERVVVSWGAAGSPDFPAGSSLVEFRLARTTTGTLVEVTHSGLPEAQVEGHADGWVHFLARLRTAAGGGVPGTDTWHPINGLTIDDTEQGSTP